MLTANLISRRRLACKAKQNKTIFIGHFGKLDETRPPNCSLGVSTRLVDLRAMKLATKFWEKYKFAKYKHRNSFKPPKTCCDTVRKN